MADPTAADVEAAMLRMQVNDTVTMKQGESDLKAFLKRPSIVGVLLQLVGSSVHNHVSAFVFCIL